MGGRKRKRHKITALGLPVSKDYVFPASRRNMIALGSVLSLAILLYFFFDTIFQKSSFIATGAISSNHATFDKECANCHELGKAVSNALCSACHEKTSELTIYDFKAHYLYRSNDFQRVSRDTLQKYANRETFCSSCHVEHRGREAIITQIPDTKCLNCHTYGSFDENHPEFEFAEKGASDDSTLIMTHLRHTVFVLKQIKRIDRLDVLFQTLKAEKLDFVHFFEEACLYCHNPEPEGKNFTNINFDQHCAECHIRADAVVEGLPKFDPRIPNKPGVETIKQMQFRGGAGISWTFVTNPNLVIDEDSEVSKNPVLHKDPWILENLKQIRMKLYPGEGLYNLLNTWGSVPIQRVDTLYSEAIRTLQNYAYEFRNRSELKGDIDKINSLLKSARQRLKLPSSRRTMSSFNIPSDISKWGLSGNQRAGFKQLALDLTAANGPECQMCHIVKNASIMRVQADQDVLIRAEFNHRVHILEKRCTECHTEIAIDEEKLKYAVENLTEFKQKFPQAFKTDRAATQNIPRLNSCQGCHAKGRVSNTCVTCHKFHPNKENRANLQLFVQGGS